MFLVSHCAGDDSRKFFSSLPCGGLGVSRNLFTAFKLHGLTETLPWFPRVALQKGLSVTCSACCKIWSFLFQTDLWVLRWWLRLKPNARAYPFSLCDKARTPRDGFVRLSYGRRTFSGMISKWLCSQLPSLDSTSCVHALKCHGLCKALCTVGHIVSPLRLIFFSSSSIISKDFWPRIFIPHLKERYVQIQQHMKRNISIFVDDESKLYSLQSS